MSSADKVLRPYIQAYDAMPRVGEPEKLRRMREIAFARFRERGFPDRRDEAWRHTSLNPVLSKTFTTIGADFVPDRSAWDRLIETDAGRVDARKLFFVNGRHLPDGEPRGTRGLRFGALRELIREDESLVLRHLGRYAPQDQNVFGAINTALFHDGGFVHVARNTRIDEPLHVIFAVDSKEPVMTHPRLLVVAEEGAEVTIIESYVSFDNGRHLTNPVTEIVAGANAKVTYHRVNDESEQSYHFGVQQFDCERDVVFQSTAYDFGGALSRCDSAVVMNGEGCHGTLNGLYILSGRQHLDNHTKLEHTKPHCDSREIFKGILMGDAHSVFCGKIHVWPGAQKTDSKQSNPNILLSPTARVDTQPQLEIYADDVKCTHGATVGQLDQDQIFYLRARGISKRQAQGIVTHAFAGEIIDTAGFPSLRDALRRLADRQLGKAELAGAAW